MFRLDKDSNLPFQIRYTNLQEKNKKSLRSSYKKRIDKLSPSLKTQKQKQITNLLIKQPFWKKAIHIGVYQALKDEPCISSFYNLWEDKVCFPVIKNSVFGVL